MLHASHSSLRRLAFTGFAILASGSFSAFAPAASAATSDNGIKNFTIHQPFMSVRAMGMGNAFTALADDYNALLYNPAGLARLEEGQINLSLITGAADSKIPKFIDDVNKASSGPDSTKGQDMNNLLEANFGNHYGLRASGPQAFWVRPRWGIAFIPADISAEMEIHRVGIAALNATLNADSTIAYGRGWDAHWFRDTRVSLGVTGKAVHRVNYSNSILASDLALNSDLASYLKSDDAREGLTFDADLGMLFSPKTYVSGWERVFHPTLGLVVRNVVDYGFTSNMHLVGPKTSGQPPKLGRRYDAGLMWELPQWSIFKVRAMADLRDMGHENWAFSKGYHLGTEFTWKIRSWWQGGWRMGINQGYFTAGFTGKLAIFNLDLATYGEEVGPSSEPKSSRRYMLRASVDW
jgi:hypothetical protein